MAAETPCRILLVEDDPDILAVIRLSLEMDGDFRVKACSTARQALEQARACAPDLLLLDVMLPDLDGPALLLALRQDPELAGVPAVFLTARAGEEARTLAGLPGVLGLIPKPFDPLRLAREVRQLWDKRPGAAPEARR